jgi:hypothetical protein
MAVNARPSTATAQPTASPGPAASATPAESVHRRSAAARPHDKPVPVAVAENKPPAVQEPVPSVAPVSTASDPPTAAAPAPALLRPREQCRGRTMLALYRCVKRVCNAAEWTNHPDCLRVRQIEADANRSTDH